MIKGKRLELVPYREQFVPNYHEWMKSPFLLEMTGSEPLSLEEEYEMQRSWRDDDKKCTFIILAKLDESIAETDRMVGDINLFLSLDDNGKKQAEVDVMIAEERYRRKGMGLEAVCLMMWYGVKVLNIEKFFAKIKQANHSSIALFEKLGFINVNFVEVFDEFEYQFSPTLQDVMQLVDRFVGSSSLISYPSS